MKYRSVNHISDFEFHDAVVKIKEYDKNNLYLYIEALNLHKDAEQNIDAKHDLEIGLATISFENISVHKGITNEFSNYSFLPEASAVLVFDRKLLTLVGKILASR